MSVLQEACAGQEMAGLPFLSCMESLRFSLSLMLDMFVGVLCVVAGVVAVDGL